MDATSDLYALGATLIHLLSDKPPSELLGPNMELRFAEHVEVSPGFLAWLQKLAAREHASRFTSATLALRALHTLDGAPHTSDEKREGTAAFAKLFVWELQQERRERRWRRGIIAGVASLVLLGLLGAAAAMFAWRPRHAAPPAPVVAQPPAARPHGFGLFGPTWKSPFGDVRVDYAMFDRRTEQAGRGSPAPGGASAGDSWFGDYPSSGQPRRAAPVLLPWD